MADILLAGILYAVTRYEEPYVGRDLYCGGVYELGAAPWFAVPVEHADLCGHLIHASGVTASGEHWAMMGRVRDVGPFGAHCVQLEDTCAPIVFDIGGAAPFDELSAQVTSWTDITAEVENWQNFQH